ncbi:MAG: DUF4838 domain-containing protein [Planctomycetota bacterium]|nr:DUF4838 domain-containing protein [Planctomycetota bacterium]
MSLIGAGAEPPIIFLIPDASQVEKFAAEELQSYLFRITGQSLTIAHTKPEDSFIFVGTLQDHIETLGGFEIDEEESIQAEDGFWMKIVDGQLCLVGVGPAGVLGAVYLLLEFLGARWYEPGPGGEFVPRLAGIDLGSAERQSEPMLRRRGLVDITTKEGIDWMGKNRLNYLLLPCSSFKTVSSWLEEETVKRAIDVEMLSTRLLDWVYPGDDTLEDPACRATVNGQAPGESEHLCASNEKVRESVVNGIRNFLESHPYISGIAFDLIGDLSRCECKTCNRNLYLDRRQVARIDEDGKYNEKARCSSDTAWEFLADLDEDLKEPPGKTFRILAAKETLHPPKSIEMPQPSAVVLRLDDRCFRYVLNSADCLPNHCLWGPVDDWAKGSVEDLVVYDHYAGTEEFMGMMFPTVRLLSRELLMHYELGVDGVVTNASWKGSIFNVLNLWAFAKQGWTGESTVDAAMDDFFTGYFGTAANRMRRYFRVWYFRWLDFRGYFMGKSLDIARLMRHEDFEKARNYLERAIRTEGLPETILLRLRRELHSYQISVNIWRYFQSLLRYQHFQQAGLDNHLAEQLETVENMKKDLISYAQKHVPERERQLVEATERWAGSMAQIFESGG